MNNSTPSVAPTCSPARGRTGIIGEAAGINELPCPLTPADCDLRDQMFMPLDVARLCNSGLAYDDPPEVWRAAVLLRCVSWHQVPAASLPNDDVWLAKHTGYWHRGKVDKDWADIRDGALRDWVRCSDGRLHHPVVAAKARETWIGKLMQPLNADCTLVKGDRRHRAVYAEPGFDEWLPPGCPRGQARDGSGEISSKAQGKVGLTSLGANSRTSAPTHRRGHDAMSATNISVSLTRWERERGKAARGFSPNNVHVIALARMALTPDELRRVYNFAVADRLGTNDLLPVNAGFIRTFVNKHRRPLKSGRKVNR